MSDANEPIPAPAAAGPRREEREVPVIPGYQIEAVAGETTSTQSWEALQISLDRRVVLLTLKVEMADDPAKVAHFEEVARIVARLHHRNFVQIIDIAKTEHGLPYVVMEKIEGRRLAELLRHDGPLPPARAAKVVLQLADALDGAWKQSGFVHRNVKPDNVWVLPDDAAKFGSFVYATSIRPGADPLASDGGMLVGTPNYMPPEQIDALRSIDFHADMYSVGMLFWQALVGRVPFGEEKDYVRIFELQKEGTLPAPSDLDPKIPEAFSRVIGKMTAKRPADRYAFWQDAIEDIHRALAGRDLYVPGGGAWVSPASTVADPTPRAAPDPKGKAKGVKAGGLPAGLRLPGRPGADAAPRKPLLAKKPAAAPAAPAPLRASPPIRAAGAAPAAAPAAQPAAAKPRIVAGPAAAAAAPAASDGGTRRSAPVAAPAAVEEEATSAWAKPEAAYVPPADATRRKKNGSDILQKLLAFVLVARPPMLVRVAGTVLCIAVFLIALRARVVDLESVPAANPRDPSSIKAVAPRVGKAVVAPKPAAAPAAKPIVATLAVRPAPAAPAAAAPVAAPAAETPPAKQPEPEVAKRLPVTLYEDALFEIARDLRRKPWTEAKSSGIRALKDVARKVPEKAAECHAIEAAFGMADSWEDLVGSTMFDHPRKREITVGRTKHTIVPTAAMPGVLVCDRVVNGMTLHNQKLDLTKMPNREKWAIVKTERPALEPAALYSRAFLTLAFGSEKDFRALVDRNRTLDAMKAFYLVYELDRK